jgi:integrase
MGRNRTAETLDTTTGRPLPNGVAIRGPGQYRARKLVNGQRITKTFTSAKLASRWLSEIEVDRNRGVFLDRSEAERKSLGDIILTYETEILGENSEKRGAKQELGHLKIVREDEVCKIKLAHLSSADLAKFRDRMKAVEYAPGTIVRRLNLIQTIIEHARREWKVNLASNPAQMVSRPAGADRKRDRVFKSVVVKRPKPKTGETDQMEECALLTECDADTNSLLGPIVRFALWTAMRQGEIIGLRWSDIDLERHTAIVRGAAGTVTKNGDIREVPLLPEAVEILTPLKTNDHAKFVFKIDQNVLKMRYRRAVARAGISDLTFHDLRHIATSRIAKLFPNPLDLKRVTGHKDLKSLDRYYHTTAQELAERARTMRSAAPAQMREDSDTAPLHRFDLLEVLEASQ